MSFRTCTIREHSDASILQAAVSNMNVVDVRMYVVTATLVTLSCKSPYSNTRCKKDQTFSLHIGPMVMNKEASRLDK